MYHLNIWWSGIKPLAICTLRLERHLTTTTTVFRQVFKLSQVSNFIQCAYLVQVHITCLFSDLKSCPPLKRNKQKKKLLKWATSLQSVQLLLICPILWRNNCHINWGLPYFLYKLSCEKKLQHCLVFFVLFCRFWVVTRKLDGG